jgi:hypothetical protein
MREPARASRGQSNASSQNDGEERDSGAVPRRSVRAVTEGNIRDGGSY